MAFAHYLWESLRDCGYACRAKVSKLYHFGMFGPWLADTPGPCHATATGASMPILARAIAPPALIRVEKKKPLAVDLQETSRARRPHYLSWVCLFRGPCSARPGSSSSCIRCSICAATSPRLFHHAWQCAEVIILDQLLARAW